MPAAHGGFHSPWQPGVERNKRGVSKRGASNRIDRRQQQEEKDEGKDEKEEEEEE